jgi:WD40 repeat protein
VRIARVDTGETVYDLSYVGMRQWPEETGPDDDHAQTNSVVFAHFLPDDKRLIVRWETYYSATWEGRMYSGYDVWSLAGDQPSATAAEDLFSFLPEFPDFLSAMPNGQVFAIKDSSLVTENGSIVLASTKLPINYDWGTHALQDWTIAFSGYRSSDSSASTPLRVTGVWDVRTGEQLARIPAEGALALSPDSSRIVIDTTVYDVATGQAIARLQNDNYRILPGTNRVLLLKSDNTVHLLDTASLEDIATLNFARSEIVGGASLSPGFWISPETHTVIFRLRHGNELVRINLDTGDTLATFETSGEPITYTPDNRYLVAGARSNKKGSLALWDVASAQPVDLPPDTQIALPVLSPDGLLVLWHSEAVPGANEVLLYDVASATPLMAFPVEPVEDRTSSPAPEISFSPGNTYLVIDNSRQVVVWDWKTGEQVLSREGASLPAFSPDDSLLAYLSDRRGSVELISVPEGELIWHKDLEYLIDAPEFVTDRLLRLTPIWPEVQETECYDVTTGLLGACPWPEPILSYLEIDSMRFFGGGIVTDLSGEELARLALPHYAVRLAPSDDHTRLWVEYTDETLGVWAVVPE